MADRPAVEAVSTYDKAALKYHGEFASPNAEAPGVRVRVVPLMDADNEDSF